MAILHDTWTFGDPWNLTFPSLRKQLTFGNANTSFPAKWHLRNKHRNSILMTRHDPDLDSISDWLNQISHAAQPIRNTTQIWVLMRHQYGISALISQTSLGGETSGSIVKCWLFSQAKHFPDIWEKNPSWWVREEGLKDSSMEQLLTTLKSTMPVFYLGFIVWGRSPEWPKAMSFLARSRGMPTLHPGTFLKWICAVMQSGAFWDNFEKCYSGILFSFLVIIMFLVM